MRNDDGLILRRFQWEDRHILAELAGNPAVSKLMTRPLPTPYRLEEADRWIAAARREKETLQFALEWHGKFAGGIGLEPIEGAIAEAELGYWLGEPYWGHGLATRAVLLILPYAFNVLLFTRLQARVSAENKKSMRVLEKNGFTQAAPLRGYIHKNGVSSDALVYVHTGSISEHAD